jgi:hypothetical protein
VLPSGITIWFSQKLRFIQAHEYENWTRELVEFWNEKKSWPIMDQYKAINQSEVFMIDREWFKAEISRESMSVWGVAWPGTKIIYLATLPTNTRRRKRIRRKMKGLLRHELSHIISYAITGETDYNKVHELFKQVELDKELE